MDPKSTAGVKNIREQMSAKITTVSGDFRMVAGWAKSDMSCDHKTEELTLRADAGAKLRLYHCGNTVIYLFRVKPCYTVLQ
jgi:hypothetical protein